MSQRSAESGWRGSRSSVTIRVLLVGLLAVSVLNALFGTPPFVREHLLLTPRKALGPEPWQLFTAAFFHLQVGALLTSAIAVWFFGKPVEQRVGPWRFALILVVSTIVGSLAAAGLGLALQPDTRLSGAGAASTAMLAAFGVLYGSTPILLFGIRPMKASTCASLFLGIGGLMYLVGGDSLGFVGAVAGAATGALTAILPPVAALRARWHRYRRWRMRRRYKVLPGGRDRRSFSS